MHRQSYGAAKESRGIIIIPHTQRPVKESYGIIFIPTSITQSAHRLPFRGYRQEVEGLSQTTPTRTPDVPFQGVWAGCGLGQGVF